MKWIHTRSVYFAAAKLNLASTQIRLLYNVTCMGSVKNSASNVNSALG